MRLVVFLAISALISACGPSNLEECRAAAAKMPTDQGVRIAVIDCQKKFGWVPAQ